MENISGIKDPDKQSIIPGKFILLQNYPNPFNPVTNIVFEIPRKENVKLIVYDLLGREIKTLLNDVLEPGRHEIYFYSIEAGNLISTKSMVLIK